MVFVLLLLFIGLLHDGLPLGMAGIIILLYILFG
jgi:hypothetical protein